MDTLNKRDRKKRARRRRQRSHRAALLEQVRHILMQSIRRSAVEKTMCYTITGRWEAAAMLSNDGELMIDSRMKPRLRWAVIKTLPQPDLEWILEQEWAPLKPKHPLQLLAECADEL